LYRELARDPRRAEDQDGFAGGEAYAPGEREPGRHSGVRQRRRGDVVDVLRDGPAALSRHHRALSHRAERRPGSAEEHAGTVIEMPNSIQATDDRERNRTRVVRAAGYRFRRRTQRGGVDANDHFALARNRLGECLAARRHRETAQYSGFQRCARIRKEVHRTSLQRGWYLIREHVRSC
jgi:hypothetical protein